MLHGDEDSGACRDRTRTRHRLIAVSSDVVILRTPDLPEQHACSHRARLQRREGACRRRAFLGTILIDTCRDGCGILSACREASRPCPPSIDFRARRARRLYLHRRGRAVDSWPRDRHRSHVRWIGCARGAHWNGDADTGLVPPFVGGRRIQRHFARQEGVDRYVVRLTVADDVPIAARSILRNGGHVALDTARRRVRKTDERPLRAAALEEKRSARSVLPCLEARPELVSTSSRSKLRIHLPNMAPI